MSIECPSKAWDRYYASEEASQPTEEGLDELDAYGHLTWCVGFDNEHGDWLACFDFEVFTDEEGEVKVAYHAIVNSDSGGFIDTMEQEVVEATKAPFDLPDYWMSICADHSADCLSESDYAEADKVNGNWNNALKAAIEAEQSRERLLGRA